MKKFPASTYNDIEKEKTSSEFFRNKLKLKSLELQKNFADKYPEAKKFLDERGVEFQKLRQHSAKIISAGALTGTLLFSPPVGVDIKPNIEIVKNKDESLQKTFINSLKSILPEKPRPLTRSEEKSLERVFEDVMKIKAKGTLEGEHLNTTFGYIGAEQHLMRYPGDTMATHPKIANHDEGMAPGRGAWGYFARDKASLTPELIETEKWYAVVQTLYLEDWSKRQPYLRDWYKYRKVLVVNTNNGNAVVAAIADAGPAAWTGKHFGGSPEVMEYLGGSRYKKGPVLMFFVDDPENKVPLGPVDYNETGIPSSMLTEI